MCGKLYFRKINKEASRLYAELLLMSSRSMQMWSLILSRSMLIIGTSFLTCGWHADDMQLLPGESLDANFVTKICGLRTFFVPELLILSQHMREKNLPFFMLNLIKFKLETKELKFL